MSVMFGLRNNMWLIIILVVISLIILANIIDMKEAAEKKDN